MNKQNSGSTPSPPDEASVAADVVPEAVRQLLSQRGTYREWLARLNDLGGNYRSEVAERVRTDYEARLEGVAEELEGHRQELESRRDERRSRLDELSASYEGRATELEEAELRHQVGEFDDATWEERRTKLTEGLEAIETELKEARVAVEELERVLTDLVSGGDAGGSTRAGSAAWPPGRAAAPRGRVAGDASRRPGRAEGEAAAEAKPAPRAGSPEGATPAKEALAASGTPAPDGTAEPNEAEPENEAKEEGGTEAAPAGAKREQAPVSEDVRDEAPAAGDDGAAEAREPREPGSDDEFMDELEFLESLSLEDTDSFDAVSRMLEDEEDR